MRDWLIDTVAALVWLGGIIVVISVTDNNSIPGGVAIPLAVGLCVALGFGSGRYRILLAPLVIIVIAILAGSIFGAGSDNCTPSNPCEEEDIEPWFWIVWAGFLLGFVELSIWSGILLRRWALKPRRGESG